MLKRIICSILIATLVLSVCACSSGKPSDEEIKSLFDDMIRLELYQADAYAYPEVFSTDSGSPDFLKVTDERYDTYAEWTAFVESIYTGEMLEQMLSELESIVIDVDGYSYASCTALPYLWSDEYTYKIGDSDENTAKITLTRTYAPVGLESTEEEFTYVLTKTGVGWRISDLVYETPDTGEPTEAPTNTPTEAPTETPAEAPNEAPIDTPNIDVGSSRCKHTVMAGYNDIDFAYHSFPGALISYVGSDRFDEWIGFYENNKEVFRTEYNEGKRDCPYGISIVDFVEYFEIPREVFEILILSNGLGYDFNIDAIYAGKEAAEEYYSSDRTQLCLAKAIIFSIKRGFPHYMYTIGATASETEWRESKLENGWYGTVLLEKVTEQYEAENKDTSKLPDAPPLDYSLTEYVHTFDIPR